MLWVGGLYAEITLTLGRVPYGSFNSSAVSSGDLLGRSVISHDGNRFEMYIPVRDFS